MTLGARQVPVLSVQLESGILMIETGGGPEVIDGVAYLALFPKLPPVLVRVTGLAGVRDGHESHGLSGSRRKGPLLWFVAAAAEEFDMAALKDEI